MSALLETKDLKKYFKTPQGWLHAVDDVNLTLNAGETLGVVGESGCGKSTLGRTVLHLLNPTSGRIVFEGKDITDVEGTEPKALRKQMQMIFQDPFSSLNPRFTIRQTIAEPLEIYEIAKSRKETNELVYKLMDTVGLARRLADSYPTNRTADAGSASGMRGPSRSSPSSSYATSRFRRSTFPSRRRAST